MSVPGGTSLRMSGHILYAETPADNTVRVTSGAIVIVTTVVSLK